jgi:hypothetical protein
MPSISSLRALHVAELSTTELRFAARSIAKKIFVAGRDNSENFLSELFAPAVIPRSGLYCSTSNET